VAAMLLSVAALTTEAEIGH